MDLKVTHKVAVALSMLSRSVLFLFLGVSLGLAGCGGVAQTTLEHELAQARANWSAQNLRSYRFTVQKSCFCVDEYTRPVTITVRDGAAVDAPEHLRDYSTVEKVLDLIETEHQRSPAELTAKFSVQGWPTQFVLDPNQKLADDEYSLSVTDLTPL